MTETTVHIIGAGLAGSEAAFQLVRQADIRVRLFEMRPNRQTEVHQTENFAELVCSNSFRSDDAESSAIGLLHEEMRRAGSLILRAGDEHRLPAGSALAVDREGFSQYITRAIENHPRISVERGEITTLPGPEEGITIIATGPLTSKALAEEIRRLTGKDSLAFFDAIAPIIYRESIDFSRAWIQSRYDKSADGGGTSPGDYINCPLDEAQYALFIEKLIEAETASFHEFEKNTPFFEACLPIEVMAKRGRETLRFGPMKPVGLQNPHRDERPHAVVQLRQDNASGTLYNIVGFQTKMKYGSQKEVFRLIPGLEKAEFARLGGMHRNSFINSPQLLDGFLRLKSAPHIFFAGQITGVEGYVESAAMGLLAGHFAGNILKNQAVSRPGDATALGALLGHITENAVSESFQPMNVNFGLFPPIEGVKKRERKKALIQKARKEFELWQQQSGLTAFEEQMEKS